MGKVHYCRQALVALLCRSFESPLLGHFHHRLEYAFMCTLNGFVLRIIDVAKYAFNYLREKNWEKIVGLRTFFFCVFKANMIQNGHCLNVQMKRTQNSDFKNIRKKVKSDL